MIPIELRITRFRSFTKETVFKFPRSPGLFFLWGENQDEPRLEANGAGKSSLWEALVWCLYGKTSRGLKAGDAANWEDGKGCRVEFDFEVEPGAGIMTIVRQWGPNIWCLIDVMGDGHDLVKDETNLLGHFLQLDFPAFLQSVLMAQAQPMFLDLKAEAKASLFSEVLGLDYWIERSQAAGKAATDQDRISSRLEREIAGFEGELRQLASSDLDHRHKVWEAQRLGDLERYGREHSEGCDKLRKAKQRLAEVEGFEAKARSHYKGHVDAKPGALRCQACNQIMPSEPTRNADKAGRELAAAEADTRDARRAVELIERDLDRIEDRAEELEKAENPFEAMLRGIDQQVMQVEDALFDLRADLAESQAAYSLKSSWVRWFKEIRLSMIGEALTQLEIEVNSCVNALGLVAWELRFAVDAETKGGNLSRGFSVSVISPHNAKPVPWEAWSGGEGQRLRIAAQQGLANLIRARSGTQLNLEIWDEPTQWMSGQGVSDLLDSLATRAKTESRQIWIVDHRSLGYGGFDGSVGAIKDKDGTRFTSTLPYISEHASESPAPQTDDRQGLHARPRKRALS